MNATTDVPQKRGPGRPPKPKTAVPASRAVYKVVRNVEHPILERTLNEYAADGWRLHTLTPAHGGYLCVFER